MKATVPARQVDYCDICYRETGYLRKCVACGREYCLTCEAVVVGCVHKMQVCRECGESDVVACIAKEYAPLILAVLEERDEALRTRRMLEGVPLEIALRGE